MKRFFIILAAICFPTPAVMFCAARADLMSAPVSVRFELLILSIVCGIAAYAITDPATTEPK